MFVEVGVDGFYGHTEEALALVDEKSYPSLHAAVRAMTGTALQVVTDEELRKTAWEQFQQG